MLCGCVYSGILSNKLLNLIHQFIRISQISRYVWTGIAHLSKKDMVYNNAVWNKTKGNKEAEPHTPSE